MIYLDYSATTPVEKVTLNRFLEMNQRFFANANSQHTLGKQVEKRLNQAALTIQAAFACPNHQVIFTSGATEANNLAILGLARNNKEQRKHIITTAYEHSSITAVIHSLVQEGFEVDFVPLLPNGVLDLVALQSLLRSDTFLVSIASVFSEMGHYQDVAEIARIVHQVPGARFHTDATQSVGKVTPCFQEVDMISYTAHKIYGLKGVGALLIKNGIEIKKQMLGGSSIQKERSGTPAFPLIDALAFSTKRACSFQQKRYQEVQTLNHYLLSLLRPYPQLVINNPEHAVPHIVNLSVLGKDASRVQSHLSTHKIYVSTQSACQKEQSKSLAVERFTQSEARAISAIRISISHLTTKAEIDLLVKELVRL